MKTFASKVLCAIFVVVVPFTVVGQETSYEDGELLVPPIAIGDDIMKEEQNLSATMAASSSNIVEIAVGAKPEFETLVAAVTAADLVGALSGPGPFTVFAPIDRAFASLPAGTLDSLLEPENLTTLQDILTYHVVSGDYSKRNLHKGVIHLTPLNGDNIEVRKNRYGRVFVNGIRAFKPEISASNGVIYRINQVLIPP